MTERHDGQPQELADDQLDGVSGGVNINNDEFRNPVAVNINNDYRGNPVAVNINNDELRPRFGAGPRRPL